MRMNDAEILPALPTLVYFLCIMSAMAFLVSTCLWLRSFLKSEGEVVCDLPAALQVGQIYSFISVMMIAIVTGSYFTIYEGQPLLIEGEIFVLFSAFVFVLYIAPKGDKWKFLLEQVKQFLIFVGICFSGWAVTLLFGYAAISSARAVHEVFGETAIVIAVFCTGLLWIFPVIVLYSRIQAANIQSEMYVLKFHHCVWSVFLAYSVLLAPLLIQKMIHSDGWKQMKYEKPVRTA